MKTTSRRRVKAGRTATNGHFTLGRAERRRRRRRARVIGISVVALVLLAAGLVGADYLVYRGKVHPGVEVAGLELSGKTEAEARAALAELADRIANEPIVFTYEGQDFETTGADLGWTVDLEATAAEALRATSGRSPWEDLWNRLRAWVTPVSVDWEAEFGPGAEAVVAGWAAEVERDPVEGRISVDGLTVVRHDPVEGIQIDADQVVTLAGRALRGDLEGSIDLPTVEIAPQTTAEDVDTAVAAAEEIISAPITARVGRMELEFLPQDLAPLVRSVVEPEPSSGAAEEAEEPGPTVTPSSDPGSSRLAVRLRSTGVGDLLEPYRTDIETEPIPAQFVVVGQTVRIKPSKPGRRIDPAIAARRLVSLSRLPGRDGKIPLVVEEPELTTEVAKGLGIEEQIASFTTYHSCCEPRVTNIHLGADNLDGAIVMPGETFSLNGRLGERTLAKGYVLAPGIYNGVLVDSPGGGISQLTTTVFNAAFFGGYPIPVWKAHSFYFSRYPMGREATLSYPNPDLQFRNDTDHALLIKTAYTDVSITVKIFSTKIRQVTALDPVVYGQSERGFSTLVVRIVRDLAGNQIRRDEFRTFYFHGVPLTEEEAEQASQSPSPTPSPTKT